MEIARTCIQVANNLSSNPSDAIAWKKTFQRVSCPALVVTADLSRSAALDSSGVDMLKALRPRLQVEHITGAGHSIRREQFARYMEVVRAFLANFTTA
jgi:N-formylmaleamate deformylase